MRHVWVCFIPTGCMVGPDYERHDAPAPVAFKELAGRKISEPADTADKGAWWSVSHDRRFCQRSHQQAHFVLHGEVCPSRGLQDADRRCSVPCAASVWHTRRSPQLKLGAWSASACGASRSPSPRPCPWQSEFALAHAGYAIA
jgi:hypothetical protein